MASVVALRKLESKAIADNSVTTAEAQEIINLANDRGNATVAEKAEIKKFLEGSSAMLQPAAKELLNKFLQGGTPPVAPTPSGAVIKSVRGSDKSSFDDDTIFLGRDGTVKGVADIDAYTRGYASTKQGVLRQRHGSEAPESALNNAAEKAALKTVTPGNALDAAAKAFGVTGTTFEKMANSIEFSNPEAGSWWGKCHAWTWSSLSNVIDKYVDVDGAEGKKGLWVAGQFVSRADLGNWMMGVADTISVADSNQLFKTGLSALDLLKGTSEYMMNNGGGVVADVYLDKKHNEKQVWNQPFVAAGMTTKTLSATDAAAVLTAAKADGVAAGKQVKQMTIVGTYGVEAGDEHEGTAMRNSKNWVMFAVTDANGKVLTAYMADDAKLASAPNLEKNTDEVPEYFWKPTLKAIDDTLAGKTNSTVEGDSHSDEFKFFINTVLQKGVPASVREAFEKDIGPTGAVSAADAAKLAKKYKPMGVANAYSPEQWKRELAGRGLDAKAFGAAWN